MASVKKDTHPFLKTSFQIGSCKTGTVSFGHSETVFHPDDFPAAKRESARALLAWKKEQNQPPGSEPIWNQTVEKDPICRIRSRVLSEHDRPNMHQYNFRAEVLPDKTLEHIPKPHKFKVSTISEKEALHITQRKKEDPVLAGTAKRCMEMPVNPKLHGKAEWNQSSYVTKDDSAASWASMERGRTANSKKKEKHLVSGYVNPEKRVAMRDLETRRMKEEGGSTAFFEAQNKAMAAASTKNRLTKDPARRTKSYDHSGNWEFNKTEERWMWSDTGSFVKDSPGDVVTVRNHSAPMYMSIR